MKRLVAAALLLLAPALVIAEAGLSQTRLQDDCLQRLKPMIPRDVQVRGVDFSALGNYATYYVVAYRFSAQLENGDRAARCTYTRQGQWVRDDAAAFKLARDLASSRGRAGPQ
jgi:hypothetical protein